MASAQPPKAKRSIDAEQRRDRRREIVRRNRARGVGANLEDALRLHRAAEAMHGSVRRRQ